MPRTAGLLSIATVLAAGCDGAHAEPVVERAPVDVVDVWAAAPDDAWGVGYPESGLTEPGFAPGPAIVHYDGATWATAWETTGMLRGVWGAAPDDVWAVGDALGVAIVAHYDGEEWSSVETGLPFDGSGLGGLADVSGSAPDDVWAVGTTGVTGVTRAWVTHFDGTGWTVEPGPEASDLAGVHVTRDGVVWAVSRREGVFRRDGATWAHFDPALPIPVGTSLHRIGEADGRIWIGGSPGFAVLDGDTFVALDAATTLRAHDALLEDDLRVFATFDHRASTCSFSSCEEGVRTDIATVHVVRGGSERTIEIRSIAGEPSERRTVSLTGLRFFASERELWVFGPSYWRVPL